MKQRLLKTIGLALLCIVGASNAWADNSKTITVKDQTSVNGSTVTRTDEVIVAYTNASNAIWYLGDYDLSSISSIDVIGAAFVSNGDEKAELKLAWMDVSSIGEVDTDYLSTNSSSIRSSAKMLAKIVAETTPTTIASGKNATHYAGADFNITSSAVTKTGTYAGTVSEGTHQAISKTSGVVHLFVYGTANSRRLAVNQIKINFTGTGVYNKTTNVEFSKINDAFNYLTDADTELEVNSDQTLTGRCTWSKAHTLTITPKQTITITANNNNYMWFLVNTNSTSSILKIGSADYKITLDGDDSKTYDVFITKKEEGSSLYLKNIEFKEFNLNSKGNICGSKSNGSGAIELEDITINSCSSPLTAFIYNAGTSDDQVRLKGDLNITNSTGTSIYTAKRIKIGDTSSIYNDFAVPGSNITINWGGATTIGSGPVVIKTPGTVFGNSGVKFELTNEDCGLYRITGSGDLKVTAAYTLTVGEAEAATLSLPFNATIQSGATAYNLTYSNGDNINASSVEAITANQAVLVTASAGSYKFTPKPSWGSELKTSGQTSANGVLIGNYTDSWTVPTTTEDNPNYILQNKASGLGFYKVVEGQNTLSPNRAYMSVTRNDGSSNNAPAFFGLNFNGMNGTTGISITSREETTRNNDGAVYNLNGVRMNGENLPKGIYVKNGRKFVVK